MPSTPQAVPAAPAVPDRHGSNLYTTDSAFAPLLALYLPPDVLAHIQPHLERMGALAGGELDELALVADKNPPVLQPRSRSGAHLPRVIKHPAYERMERMAFGEFGLAAMSHRAGVLGWPQKFPPLVKYALTYLFVQAEFGLCCPLSMTDSLIRTLHKSASPALVQKYAPQLLDPAAPRPVQGAMFMTEQAAGSDIANTRTLARPGADGTWLLYGDKWFCSNPDADFAMVLARVEGDPQGMKGISLFLLPRWRGDGSHNAWRIVRLKDKLGTRSMASGEIVLEGATAHLVGERGRGFVQIADMVNHSRLSNGVRAAGLMRRAVAEAQYVARHRRAFGKDLQDMPLMQRQLDKLRIFSEQARTMVMQTAQALERADAGDRDAAALLRILTPLIKFRACRDARKVTGDAMEVRGGCGYIEEWSDPRLVRDAHLGSIWEGTSNIVALDVLRAIERENSLPAWQTHVAQLLEQAAPGLPPAFHAALQESRQKAAALAQHAAADPSRRLARSAASALYHSFSAVAMSWEAVRIRARHPQTGAARLRLAQLVLLHRVLPRDPLQVDDGQLPAGWDGRKC